MKSISYILSILFCFGVSIVANGQLIPKYGGQRAGLSTLGFLKNDISPRSFALSGSSVALEGDAYSIFNNPAAIASKKRLHIGLSDMVLGNGLHQTFVSGYKPFGLNTFGLSVNSMYADAMKVRTEFAPNGTGEMFYFSSTSLGLTYAKSLSDMFSLGITLKYIYEQIASYYNHTASIDLGFLYKTDFKDLKFAVLVQNFGGNSSIEGDILKVDFNRNTVIDVNDYTVPTVFSLGFSIVPYKDGDHSLLTSFQLNHPNDNAENMRFGIEYNYKDFLIGRAGYKINVSGQSLPSIGIGMRSKIGVHPLTIDYGFLPSNYFGMLHCFGIGFEFNNMKRE